MLRRDAGRRRPVNQMTERPVRICDHNKHRALKQKLTEIDDDRK